MTPSELLAWARATAPGRADELLSHYAAYLQLGCSGAYLRASARVTIAAQLTPMGLDTAPPLDVTEPVSVQPETMR